VKKEINKITDLWEKYFNWNGEGRIKSSVTLDKKKSYTFFFSFYIVSQKKLASLYATRDSIEYQWKLMERKPKIGYWMFHWGSA
jgi:hypothetical protein